MILKRIGWWAMGAACANLKSAVHVKISDKENVFRGTEDTLKCCVKLYLVSLSLRYNNV